MSKYFILQNIFLLILHTDAIVDSKMAAARQPLSNF